MCIRLLGRQGYRWTASPPTQRQLKQLINQPINYCIAHSALQIDGEPIEKPHPLEWYPGQLAWQMNFTRAQVRMVL